MRYKVGDRVKFIKSVIYHNKDVKLGEVYTIKDIHERGYRVENREWFKEEELQKVEYTYEDLKKSPIGTKVTFEDGVILIKLEEDFYENNAFYRNNENLKGLKDNINLGKIIKVEKPEYETVYEAKLEILDEVEKRYLRGVIRPFRDRVKIIRKFIYSGGNASIDISIDDSNTGWLIELLPFPKNEMYKGMEDNKKYTIEELGL